MNQKYHGQDVHDEKYLADCKQGESGRKTSLSAIDRDLEKTTIALNGSAKPSSTLEHDAGSPSPGNEPREEVTYPEGGFEHIPSSLVPSAAWWPALAS